MAQDYDDCLDTAFAKVVDAAFDYGFVSEREERLERAHAL
jgi:hypothetical protein